MDFGTNEASFGTFQGHLARIGAKLTLFRIGPTLSLNHQKSKSALILFSINRWIRNRLELIAFK